MTSSENTQERVTPSALLGRGMRRVREAEGKVLHDVASAARELGMKWDPSLVSRIETGKRELSLDEFWMLPHVMSLTLNRPVLLSELLPPKGDVNFLAMPDQRVHLLSEFLLLSAEALTTVSGWEATTEKLPEVLRDTSRKMLTKDMREAQSRRDPEPDGGYFERLDSLARELNVKPGAVFDATVALWDTVDLASERERRLVASGEDLSNPTRLRTIRGHITRQLVQEVRDYLEANPPKPTKTRKG